MRLSLTEKVLSTVPNFGRNRSLYVPADTKLQRYKCRLAKESPESLAYEKGGGVHLVWNIARIVITCPNHMTLEEYMVYVATCLAF